MTDPHTPGPDRGRDDVSVADTDDQGDAAVDDGEKRVVSVVDADGSNDENEDERFLPPREPIEPESPSAENALFVLLGVLGTIALLASAILPGVL